MPKITDLHVLLVQEIKDLYSAENQLVKALPKMAKAASSPELKQAFLDHLEQTKGHVERLTQVAELLGASPKGKVCKAMKGLIEEGGEALEEEGDPACVDLCIITAAQKVEHYEISGYGSVRVMAETLGLKDVVKLLTATINEEGTADKNLTTLAESIIAQAPLPATA